MQKLLVKNKKEFSNLSFVTWVISRIINNSIQLIFTKNPIVYIHYNKNVVNINKDLFRKNTKKTQFIIIALKSIIQQFKIIEFFLHKLELP